MGELDGLAARFEESRPRLRAVAYRMLGSASEADDAIALSLTFAKGKITEMDVVADPERLADLDLAVVAG